MRPAGRSRLRAAAVVAAVLLAQIGGLAHGALASHVRCEHGEFVEADEAALAPRSPDAQEAGVAATKAEPGASSDHQHCLAQLHARAPLVLRSLSLVLAAPSGQRGGAPSRRVHLVQRDRYRLVPKQSPPA